MKYQIEILSVDEFVENVLKINLSGVVLEVLTLNLPFPLDKTHHYMVDLETKVFDDYQVIETNEEVGFKKIWNTLGYNIVGVLINGVMHVDDLLIFDEILLSDYGHLENRKVKWMVDRIDIDFEWNEFLFSNFGKNILAEMNCF